MPEATRPLDALLHARRERVARVIANGTQMCEAASLLFLSPETIEIHLSRIYRTLGVRNRTDLERAYPTTPDRHRQR